MKLTLPHWADVVVSLLVVLIAWTMKEQSAGDLTLPAWGVTLLTVVSTGLGMWSQSVLPAKTGGAK